MNDQYTPATDGSLQCPHCGATGDSAPVCGQVIKFVAIDCACSQCQRDWQETRRGDNITRYWEAQTAAHSGQHL